MIILSVSDTSKSPTRLITLPRTIKALGFLNMINLNYINESANCRSIKEKLVQEAARKVNM